MTTARSSDNQDDATPASRKGWYYIDSSGRNQGPYPSDMMRRWFEAGHFHADLMVRNGDNGVYSDIESLGSNAFLPDAASAMHDALNSIQKVLTLYK